MDQEMIEALKGSALELLIRFAAQVVAVFVLLAVAVFFAVMKGLGRRAEAAGDPGVGAYLRAAPRNDEEKRHAVDLTLKGVVLCVLGLFFPPLLLVGLFPFYYGTRKLCLAWMGLGILDDGPQTSA